MPTTRKRRCKVSERSEGNRGEIGGEITQVRTSWNALCGSGLLQQAEGGGNSANLPKGAEVQEREERGRRRIKQSRVMHLE